MKKEKYDVFKAIADPTRRKIMALLVASGASTITAIASDFNWTRQVVTKHIYVLEKAGLVSIEDSGRERYCSLQFAPLKEVYDWVAFYEKFWDDKLASLKGHLAQKQPSVSKAKS
jgi:DNA-binding transcriptional ArsR family regulator